ncbi:hypothetical protein [Rufibacter hautae]|uniref:Uncharacterized protein n=1 Tax=Rufibacter hautae TaxID=2595005 RepID=A0A5B6TN38_9BACT|nr:hypothetical protein [Rufibacter hautae]KAA3437733.1 hypothetical protein FOA19_10545 [Rufibacter hautae]
MNDSKATLSVLPKVFRNRLIQRCLSWLLLSSFLPLALSCNYYRLKEEKDLSPNKVASLPNYKRFILHQDKNAWEIKNLAVKETSMTGTLSTVPEDLLQYIDPKPGSANRYKRPEQAVALNVVHLYVYEFAQQDNQADIPFSALRRIDIADKDTGATVASHVLGTIGILAGTLALITVIVALTKSSCPFVYVKNSSGYHFVGEAYGGAIFSPLERDDYMPLNGWEAAGGQVQVKITNELKERQYTNLAELLVVDHKTGTKVLLDQKGQPHTLQNVIAPQKATTSAGKDYTQVLQAQDSAAFSFNCAGANTSSVALQFPKPTGSTQGKLVLHAQNSLWLDYLYGEFTKQFKGIYNHWAEKQKDVPATDLYKWQREQGIPLLVEVKTARGWQEVERIQSVGPLASRDLVVPIDLTQVTGPSVQVRLSCGFMFWEVDQAGMDFSPNQDLSLQKVPAATAIEKSGQNIGHLLAASDDSYLKQFSVGDAVELTFSLPKKAEAQTQTIFLHTRGYYEHLREYTGIPNLISLRDFEKPGHFMQFSRQQYAQLAQENNFHHLASAHARVQ